MSWLELVGIMAVVVVGFFVWQAWVDRRHRRMVTRLLKHQPDQIQYMEPPIRFVPKKKDTTPEDAE